MRSDQRIEPKAACARSIGNNQPATLTPTRGARAWLEEVPSLELEATEQHRRQFQRSISHRTHVFPERQPQNVAAEHIFTRSRSGLSLYANR